MQSLVFPGEVKSGEFIPYDKAHQTAALKNAGDFRAVQTISKYRKPRSSQQNRYYWGICVKLISEHTGYENTEVHEILREMFLGHGEERFGMKPIKSTTALSTVEFKEYVEKIQRFAAQTLGVVIPDPPDDFRG